jgi:hypothetical protein
MKKIISINFLLVIMFLVACSGQEKGELTRIDVVARFDAKEIEHHIQLKEELTSVENAFNKVKWEPNVEPKMARESDVKAIFFYIVDKNMPERLVEYEIWFNQNKDTATIISDNENEGYGTLDNENAEILKSLFVKVRGKKQ